MRQIDHTEIFYAYKKMNPHCDFDQSMTFYYDETNNIRKFWFRPVKGSSDRDFNVGIDQNFILGGICFKDKVVDFSELIAKLNIKDYYNTNEIKFGYVASGSFLDCLRSKQLNIVLAEIEDKIANGSMFVHTTNLNYMYYSIVDVIDELNNIYQQDPELNRYFKNQIYLIFLHDQSNFLNLLKKVNFPNLSKFDFQLLLNYCKDAACRLNFNKLEKYLNRILPLTNDYEPILLAGNTENVLLDRFTQFYHAKIYSFPQSTHIFDNEAEIIESLSNIEYIIEGKSLNNYKFIDSKSDFRICISDIWVGIFSKFVSFCKGMDSKQTLEWVNNHTLTATKIQKENLYLLCKIIYHSSLTKPECDLTIDADYEINKMIYIVNKFRSFKT